LTKLHRGKNKQDAKRSSNNEEKQQWIGHKTQSSPVITTSVYTTPRL
jgi:hypothetical protein